MTDVNCSICLGQLKSPVAIPCGHVYCEKCLTSHIQTGKDACNSQCPTCRTNFSIAMPDLRYVPAKYHGFMKPSVCRLYLEIPSQAKLKVQIASLESRVESLGRDKVQLISKCESSMAASAMYAEQEKTARLYAEKAKAEVEELKKRHDLLNDKYLALKSKTVSEDAADLHPHSRSHTSVSIPDPIPDHQARDTSPASSPVSSRPKRSLPSRAARPATKNSSSRTIPAASMCPPTRSRKRSRVSDISLVEKSPHLHNNEATPTTQSAQSLPEEIEPMVKRSRWISIPIRTLSRPRLDRDINTLV